MTARPLSEYATLEATAALQAVNSREQGLTEAEVLERRKLFGRNEIGSQSRFALVVEFLRHFQSPLVIILLFASVVSFVVGDEVDAIIIIGMVFMSTVLDFFEEKNAHEAADKLRDRVRTKVSVVRNGVVGEIFSAELCPGDIVRLNAGRIIPADLRLLATNEFFVNQSALTGESFPVEKHTNVIQGSPQLDELTNIGLMGSSVVTGSATGLVVATGVHTYFGSIAQRLIAPSEESSFSKGVREFGYLVLRITILLILFIFLVNGVLRHDWFEAFMFALAVAVGLAPELLTMVMSVSMARGSLRIAQKGAIVKRLAAIPNFGSMDVLCTDKTGTLTQDKIAVVRYTNLRGETDADVLRYAFLNSYFQAGMVNPLDNAVLDIQSVALDGAEKVDEIPFDFIRKRLSIAVKDRGRCLLISKGAPEEVLRVCRNPDDEQAMAQQQYQELSLQGFKVLAIGIRELSPIPKALHKEDERDLTLIGFISFLDPPRPEVAQTIQRLNQQGIEVKIITGDNHLVATKICSEIGLPIHGILLGADLDILTEEALQVKVKETTLFARFSPEQKNRVIRALKVHHTVGYLGDGINDAPSLKSADVGISVENATDVTKESADIILTRKSLSILSEAVMEGRKTFINTLKYIQMGLSSNFGNMFSMAIAAIFLPFLPMLPVQILLNNFIYDFSQITIPTDHVDRYFITKPQSWDLLFIRRFMIVFGIVSSVFDLITFYIFYVVYSSAEHQFQTAWFLESLTTQSLVIFSIRTHHRPFSGSHPSWQLTASTLGSVAVAWLIPYTPLGGYFNMVPLTLEMSLVIFLLVLIYLVLVEVVKRYFYLRKWGNNLPL
ncbi:MAG: magnesium-translocating P-type ATPase [Cyclobacteriaceae bacterium]|nr:magnesium-translocating P-type ATPase [Cyclobacteriaceae bacterium]